MVEWVLCRHRKKSDVLLKICDKFQEKRLKSLIFKGGLISSQKTRKSYLIESFKSVILLGNYENSNFTMRTLRAIEKLKETYKGSELWIFIALLILLTLIYDFGFFFD